MAVQAKQEFSMDQQTAQGFVRFFKGLPEKSNTTVRFFNRGEYYSMHGEDALVAAEEIFKTTAACKTLGAEPNKIEGLILKKSLFESYVRDLLLVKLYRVEVFVNRGGPKNQDWVVEYKGSPGNLSQFEDLIFGNTDIPSTPNVIAVKIANEGSSKVVGVSCIDAITFTISVCEFKDEETLADLESLVVTLAPKECIAVQSGGENNPDFQALKQLMERNNVLLTTRKKAEFNNDSIFQDLNFLVRFAKGQQRNAQALPETNLELAMASTGALIKYLDLISEESNSNQFTLKEIQRARYVKLDAAAIKALNLEPKPESGSSSNNFSSILGILDKCRTALGRRLLAQWIRQPLRDLSLIKERHDIVEALVNDFELRSCLTDDFLKRIPDLQQLAKKLSRKKAGLLECYKIYQCMTHLPVMVEKLNSLSNIPAAKATFLEPLKELLEEMDKFQQMVEQTIDLSAAERGEFFVKPEFDDELKDIKATMNEKEEKIQKQLHKVAADIDMEAGKQVKLEFNPQYGYHLRVTLNNEKAIRKHTDKYNILDSIKGGVRFNTDRIDQLNSEYCAAKDNYTAHQKSVVTEIIDTACGYVPPIRGIAEVIAVLDVLNSFAVAAVFAPKSYIRPAMLPHTSSELKLVQVRHPCLEFQEDTHFIPNDVILDKEVRFCIVTGPNMGGKSTYIRSAGVVALMAHIGSFVPCDEATISVLDCILARIGADDSQIKGLSTFMAEMVETASIIKCATERSLVIIDELGRGTSTYDGCGIAWAIAEHLARNVKCYCLFATHFHEITRLVEDVPTVRNYHVTAQVGDKLILLYKVIPGICDQSFGIHVAKMANFPAEVIEFAKKKQMELEDLQGIVFDGSDDPEKKNKIIDEGQKLIAEFANKVKELDKSLSEDVLHGKVMNFKDEILSHKNPYINALLT